MRIICCLLVCCCSIIWLAGCRSLPKATVTIEPSESELPPDTTANVAITHDRIPRRPVDSLEVSLRQNAHFQSHHIAFMLSDPETQEEILSIDPSRYFVPASNVKLFTLLAAHRLLGDSVASIQYTIRGDSLIWRGTGDPSFMHTTIRQHPKIEQLLRHPAYDLYYDASNFQDERYGPGWSWEDYPYYFQVQKSAFPLYGNTTSIDKEAGDSIVNVSPAYMRMYLSLQSTTGPVLRRSPNSNRMWLDTARIRHRSLHRQIPILYSDSLMLRLLSDTLHKTITRLDEPPKNPEWKTLNGLPTDSLYPNLLHDSDNFVGEQILLLIAGQHTDTLNVRRAIDHIRTSVMAGLPDSLRWVDGSGLSRYNLVTARSIQWVLHQLWRSAGWEQLSTWLPSFDINTGDAIYDRPFVYAKTGSMSNHYTLSGYIECRSGRILAFTFLHNHFLMPRSVVQRETLKVLAFIHMHY